MYRKQWTIMMIMAMTTLIYNMAHPVTPQLIAEQGQGPLFLGIVFAAMAFANFAMSPIWGKLSDRYGRKPIMAVAPVGYGLAQIGFGYATSPGWIIIFRLIAGMMASASFIGGTAYIIDVSKPSERSKQLAFYTALTGFTGSLGYLLGGWVGNEDYHHAFDLQFLLSILLGLLIWGILPESNAKDRLEIKAKATERTAHPIEWHVTVILVLIVVYLTSLIYKGFDISFNAYLKFSLGFSPLKIGLVMAGSGLIGLITNFVFYPLLKRRYHDFGLLLTTILIMGILSFLFIFKRSLLLQALLIMLFLACLALYKPLLQAILSKMGKRNGELMGWNNAANSLGLVIGSAVLGAIFDIHPSYAFLTLAVTAFIAAGLLGSKKAELYDEVKESPNETISSSIHAREAEFTRPEMVGKDLPDHL